MAFPRATRQHRPRNGVPAGQARIEGVARLGERTKRLAPRLKPGDIAVIRHEDIDRVSGDDLVASGVRCVLNASPSSSGSYPNPGPLALTRGGVHLVDFPGDDLFDVLKDGEAIAVEEGRVLRGAEVVAEGEVQQPDMVEREHTRARLAIGEALRAFAENTVTHLKEEGELLAGGLELPELDTQFRDRPALVVVRGVDHQKDLRILRPYVRDMKPVLVAVDGGAQAIIDEGFSPDMIVGDMDSAGDEALGCGAELVVHAYPDGRAPGRDRLERLGLPYKVVPAPATSEDVALLIASERGASLIVAVGTHFNLVEFLDKARRGMSSTFLTRLRVGEILVDAKGVSRLYRPSAGRGPLILVAFAALVALVVAVSFSPNLGPLLDLVWLKVQVLLGID